MNTQTMESYDQFYMTYSGVSLPLNLINPITQSETENRNTFFATRLDEKGRVVLVHKIVYGEVEQKHRYGFNDTNQLQWAEITDEDGEVKRLEFEETENG